MCGGRDACQPPLKKPLIDDAENFGEEDESAVQSTSMWKSAGKKTVRAHCAHQHNKSDCSNQLVKIETCVDQWFGASNKHGCLAQET